MLAADVRILLLLTLRSTSSALLIFFLMISITDQVPAAGTSPGRLLPAYAQALSRIGVRKSSIVRRTACVRAFIKFHYETHPSRLNEQHIRLFIIHLRHHRKFSLARCQACTSALLFLYRHLLGQPDFYIWDPTHPALLFSRRELML